MGVQAGWLVIRFGRRHVARPGMSCCCPVQSVRSPALKVSHSTGSLLAALVAPAAPTAHSLLVCLCFGSTYLAVFPDTMMEGRSSVLVSFDNDPLQARRLAADTAWCSLGTLWQLTSWHSVVLTTWHSGVLITQFGAHPWCSSLSSSSPGHACESRVLPTRSTAWASGSLQQEAAQLCGA